MARLLVCSLVFIAVFDPILAQVPSFANVACDSHPRQAMDVYLAKAEAPTPLLFFVHGDGWMTGEKANPDFLAKSLGNGISVVSINYRLITDATEAKISPPVKACPDDAARALQFVRSKAAEWEIDKQRIGGCGGSAGGFTVPWLAFHPEMADPMSSDPVA
jgi:acetyl esterase/lipase